MNTIAAPCAQRSRSLVQMYSVDSMSSPRVGMLEQDQRKGLLQEGQEHPLLVAAGKRLDGMWRGRP